MSKDLVNNTESNEIKTVQEAAILLREAIQAAEEFGLVRTEDGQVITGAQLSEHGVILVKE
ncbi:MULTISPECIES: hypothetical protein [Pseudomonadota]|uniref:hypothetical protein n=1 Tax=Pseudomonadota TaxID=1224 RepID=UPI000154553D|nr:hypothetical protein [Bradyrhizobium canariense]EDL67447.1 hypothetical protein A1Q_4537 [Vibrio campbellii HY01]EIO2938079.1 hypothetical protein [Vibrio parahaemolyticus]OSI58050.1 hypothetical protein BSZ20_00415 [Bradyrhizobium canariense]QJT70791.1 hypothetical protein [Vibrio phage HY01]